MESTFYPYLGALGWTGLFLLIGTIIRAKVKFFQTFLFPASLIGGIIGFFRPERGLARHPQLHRLEDDHPG